jgi:hypothetical protein
MNIYIEQGAGGQDQENCILSTLTIGHVAHMEMCNAYKFQSENWERETYLGH